jgi:hypothetical protein
MTKQEWPAWSGDFLPAGIIVAHKTSSTEQVRNDAGIVFLPECEPSSPTSLRSQRWVCPSLRGRCVTMELVVRAGSSRLHGKARRNLRVAFR